MQFKTILSSVKQKISAIADYDPEKLEISPHRDWAIAVSIFFVALATVAGAGLYLFVQISSGEIFSVKKLEDETVRNIDVGLLRQVLTEYSQKEQEIESLLEQQPRIADPSQ